jgi:hypothetical protein
MRVFCCYTNLSKGTERTVRVYAPEAEFVKTEGDYGYFDFLNEQWNGESDLVIIEQDIEITEEVIPSFRDCSEQWCVFSYQGPPDMGYLHRSIGCTRFSASLQKEMPILFSSNYVRRYRPNGFEVQVHWQWIDNFMWAVFAGAKGDKATSHVHGEVCHRHSYRLDDLPEFADEKTPDGKSERRYTVNPDGTRGKFISEVRKYH